MERSGTNNQSDLNEQMQDAQQSRDYLQRMLDKEKAKSARPDDQGLLGQMLGDAHYYDKDKATNFEDRIKNLDDTIKDLSKKIENGDKENKQAMAMLMEKNRTEFEKIFDEYDYNASMEAGELVKKSGTNNQENKANAVANTDPSILNNARMRIMKQYLPMTGSSDSTQTAEDQYYSTSIVLMKEQLALTKKQLAELEKL